MEFRFIHIVEYIILRGVAGFVGLLPYRLALGVAWTFAALAYHGVRWRRAEAERRVREVFGGKVSKRQVRHITWISIRNLAFNIMEVMMASRMNRAWLERHAEWHEGDKTLSGQVANGGGAILAVIHMGNWDLAGLGLEQLGFCMMAIARKQKNPLVDNYLNRKRAINESVIVYRDDPALMKNVLGWLKDGKVVAILIDLRAREKAATFSFLGKEVNLGRGLGVIARHSGAPIYPVITIRKGWARHDWRLCTPIRPDPELDKKSDSVRMIQACLQNFEEVILDRPDQYFWYNTRWVLDPLDKQTPTTRE